MQSGFNDMPPVDEYEEYDEFYDDVDVEPKIPIEKKIWRFFIESLETLIIAIVLFVIIESVSARIRVDGQSMEPSFSNGNFVIVNRLAYRFGEVHHGDVIVFPSPDNYEQDCPWSLFNAIKLMMGIEFETRCPVRLIKRIIGIPGDTVRVSDGHVYVNDQQLVEPYIKEATRGEVREVTVPAGSVYVMGDNRNNSSDSRRWGPLDIASILGKSIFVYWPFDEFGSVGEFEYVYTTQ